MDRDFKAEIVALLNEHQIMTVATIRRDGWPQATVVSYANDGLVLYSIIGRNTQKYLNIVRDPRVSAAISGVSAQPLQYKGLSLAGHATVAENHAQIERVRAIVLSRNPQYMEMPARDPTPIAVMFETADRVDHRLFQELRSFRPGADFGGSAGRARGSDTPSLGRAAGGVSGCARHNS